VISLRDSIVGNVRPALLVLFGVVALVMLIACANIANLLLARGTSRTREIAVRSAFGAERRRLIRQLLTESLLMALLGSAVGLLLAFAMLRGLLALSAGTIPNSEAIGIEPLAVLFCLGAALVVWPLFALLPAWKSSSTNIVDALKEGARGASSGPQRTGMREMLVIGEIAMAAMLLVGSGLLLNSLWRLVHVDPGFNAARVLSLHLTVPAEMFKKEGQDEQYRNEIIDSVARVPGVLAVGGSKTVPLNGSGEPYEFGLTAFSERGPIRPSAGVYIVTPGYFQALQIPLKSGRTFTRADDQGDRRLLVVSQSMARKIWGHEDAVGKTLYIGTKAAEVIGVVGDVHNEALSAEARDTIYMPTRLAPRSSFNLFIRTNGDPLRSVNAIREAIWSVDKDQAVSDIATMQQVVSEHVAQPRFFTVLLSVFGALAITLAAIGAYGVISYSVRERTQEFGIRMALGADRGQVLGLVLKRAMGLVAIGLGFGLIGALITTRFLSTLLFGVKPMDLATFAGASILLLAIALLASYVPARWATRVEPAVALRNE
jgi:putative ABC transport system permease protein